MNNKIKLYHYSNKNFRGYIKTNFFGENNFTSYSKKLSNIRRSYFYTSLNKRECYFMVVKFLYIVEVDKNKLYNLNDDTLNIGNKSSQYIFKTIKDKGYRGIIGNNGIECVVLFYDIKIKNRKVIK